MLMPSTFVHERLVDVPCLLQLAHHLPVIDVRSPAEFMQGHIPGAYSLPLFDDMERASLGTLYKHEGRDAAFAHGLTLVEPKLSSYLSSVLSLLENYGGKVKEHVSRSTCPAEGDALSSKGSVAIYCWRGGERSASVGAFLEEHGVRVHRLTGGYKAFRRHCLDVVTQPFILRVLGGKTGTGKTAVLHALRDAGCQVIDLEHLARHRGSAFGRLENVEQPTCEHFENRLACALHQCRPDQAIWLEDESEKLGKVRIPALFFQRMQEAEAVLVQATTSVRLQRILQEYGTLSVLTMLEALSKIKKRLGLQRFTQAVAFAQAGDILALAQLLLQYYDKGYDRQMKKRHWYGCVSLRSPAATAQQLMQLPRLQYPLDMARVMEQASE